MTQRNASENHYYNLFMIEMWRHAERSVRDGHPATLVVVVDHTGSVPGTTGAAIVVSESGCVGTVGGGIAEHEIVDQAREFSGAPDLIDIEHTPDASGSLCSGSHILAMLRLTTDDLPVLAEIVATLEGDRVGTLRLAGEGLGFDSDRAAAQHFVQSEAAWSFSSPIGRLDTLYIFGGGHVSLALSRVMATLPFRIVVCDDRPELPTMTANHFAHELRVVDYGESEKHVAEGDRSWVVVMTYGHEHDATVLRRLLELDLRYLGLLGSAAKVRQMFARFSADGVAQERLDRVSAPVGVSIGSHTPEEIAISIAAEIVQLKNRS
jgi:xanthine dehydrogenase accessory factor